MKLTLIYRILLIISYFVGLQNTFSQDARMKYQEQLEARQNNEKYSQPTEKLEDRFDCVKHYLCQIPFRRDCKDYLDLKYVYKRKLIYHLDKRGYYYFTYSPAAGKSLAYDFKVRVYFNPAVSGNRIADISIDTSNQSGTVYFSMQEPSKPIWKWRRQPFLQS